MTHLMVDLRHRFFRWAIPLLMVLATLVTVAIAVWVPAPDGALVLSGVGVLLSLIYFLQKQKLEELQLFRGLFESFNARYDAMNEALSAICEKAEGRPLSEKDIKVLVDYFNLCSEEYLYYRTGYIYPEVWRAWLAGMRFYYRHPLIGEKWDEELAQNSYYGLHPGLLGKVSSEAPTAEKERGLSGPAESPRSTRVGHALLDPPSR